MNDELPSGWVREQRALPERRDFQGVSVLHVIGWQAKRHCGCCSVQGMRMDNHEPTFGVVPCELHGAQVERAFLYLKHSPPRDQEITQMFAQALEREIEIAP
jgi:hypothetical protein